MERVCYGGFGSCYRLLIGEVEALVTLDYGPRVIRYGFAGDVNQLVEYGHQLGKSDVDTFRSYGGHRLWCAPEDPVMTYEPDNSAVVVEETGRGVRFVTPSGASGIQKSFELVASDSCLTLQHRLENLSSVSIEVAPWCLTVMRPGGECFVPLPSRLEHSDALLPGTPLVLWRYTELTDPRFTLGQRLVRLRQDIGAGPTKFGLFVHQGWAGYLNDDVLFMKQFPALFDRTYPDFGCNFECFTRSDMLEVESLGPLSALAPGNAVVHTERWHLFRDVQMPSDDVQAETMLSRFASQF